MSVAINPDYLAQTTAPCPTCSGRRWISTQPRDINNWGIKFDAPAAFARELAAPRIPCPAKCAEPYGWDVARLEADAAVLARGVAA